MTLAQQIAQGARARGLDPQAVLAVAGVEGLGSRRPGDRGTSFGPFMLHMGGALPRQHYGDAQQWASSPQGLGYALNEIAKVARGLHGRQAVGAIVNQFERPQNPGAEIAKAWGRYGNLGGGPAVGSLTPPPAAPSMGQAAAPDNQRQIGMALINAIAPGQGHGDFSPVYQLMQQKQAQAHEITPGVLVDHQQKLAPDAVKVVELAKRYQGVPYQWGGTTPKGFDCSGFVQFLYAHAGIHLPRTTYEQIHAGVAVNPAQLRPGDILFFGTAQNPHHEGLYIGHGQFIQAPHTGDHVRISALADYGLHLVAARRVSK